MGFREGICPKCHEVLQVPEEREKILCMYCGQEIETEAAVREAGERQRPASAQVSSEELYREIRRDFLGMLGQLPDPMKGFKKQSYEGLFQEYYQRNLHIIEGLEKAYCVAEDREAFLEKAAQDFVGQALKDVEALEKKGRMEDRKLKNNMAMVVYILPAVQEYHGASSRPLAEKLVECWNAAFDRTNIKLSSYEFIQSGFKRRFCYITTAVCESLKKGDDCYELNVLRNYRDSYLMKSDDGEDVVREYYNIAPTIVKQIERRPDAKEIYRGIYDRYLKECIALIGENRMEECRRVYTGMVKDLKEAYFLQGAYD